MFAMRPTLVNRCNRRRMGKSKEQAMIDDVTRSSDEFVPEPERGRPVGT
jgi:hypothetical protein